MNRDDYIEKLKSLFERYSIIEAYKKKLIFWGTGAVAEAWWDDMNEAGLMPKYVVDSKKAGAKFKGYDIVSPEEIAGASDCAIVIMSTNPYLYQEITDQIKGMNLGVQHVFSCSALYYWFCRERIINLTKELDDEDSMESLISLMKARMEGKLLKDSDLNNKQYFPIYLFSRWDDREVYVDAGAFVGDTLEMFLFEKFGTFESYYAFEPLRKNFEALKFRVERLEREWGIVGKIVCVNQGLDKEIGEQKMSSLFPVGATIGTNEEKVGLEIIKTVSIDEYFEEKRISTIKADIEGKEMDMLMGAEKSIKKWKPKMAISIYHKPSDLYKIFELIKSFDLDYKFAVRCHCASGGDTVLYAY